MEEQKFTTVIKPRTGWFDLKLKEVYAYRDLIFLFVKRNFISKYKQTILGPAWAVIQPLLTTVVFTLVFGNIAGLAPGGIPSFIFYLSGTVLWTYFSNCLGQTANTFVANSATMGKVYFPRLVMPISTVVSELISLAIQFFFMVVFLIYYLVTGQGVRPGILILMTPFIVLQLRHNHIGAHNEISRPCDARRLRNTTVDVCFPDSLRYVRFCSLRARRKVAHALYVQSGNADSEPVQICISRHRRGRVEILFYRLGDDICRAAYRRHALQPC